MKNEKFSSQLRTYFKDTWDLGARWRSDCVEGSWRDKPCQKVSKAGLICMKETVDFGL
jgi:hypothetical protein